MTRLLRMTVTEPYRHKLTLNSNPDWGHETANGSWTGFIGQLQRHEQDVAFCLFYPTNSRNRIGIPSTAIIYEDVVALVGLPRERPTDPFAFLTAFGLYVWLALLGSLVVVAAVYASAEPGRRSFIRSWAHYVFRLIGNVFFEANPSILQHSASRLLDAAWWAGLIILMSGFSGELLARLAIQPSPKRITTPQQLSESDHIRPVMLRGPAYPLLLAISSDETSRKLYQRLLMHGKKSLVSYSRLWSHQTFEDVAAERAAIIADRTTLEYNRVRMCGHFPQKELYVVRERVLSHPLVLYSSKNISLRFVELLNKRIFAVQESGILQHWYDGTVQLGGDAGRCPRVLSGAHKTAALGLQELLPVATLLAIGAGTATIVLVAEIGTFYLKVAMKRVTPVY
ncbi:glutamate receptor ionotropic, kainate 5-like [Ornithodoros turicata]|uniref:glutamate receptor ionotropic, kainate 5-like n=1 Tax=Ornithodoros turicata TaxID=34597 RepID=UPI003138ED09